MFKVNGKCEVCMMRKVELRKINSENWREALRLSVYVEQQKFVAAVTPPVAIALAKAYIKPDGKIVDPFGIYNQDKMIGFFNLHFTPDSKEDYWLLHFFIDKRFQRNGFGSESIKELIKHLKHTHPSCNRLRLTVHPENDAGKLFYIKLGFNDDHTLTYGEPTYSIYI
jgi:diamine N-acetyltransferase